MHYFISAGEASGDLHASQLMQSLRKADPEAQFTFLGGDMMAEVAGHAPVIHYNRMAYMGFVEVVKHLRAVMRNLSTARQALRQAKPDRLVLVDYPSFNLKLAHEAAKTGIPVYWYISPKVWAWKEGRVKQFKKLGIRILSILPFEPKFFRERHDYEATYVGNPSLAEVDERRKTIIAREELLKRAGAPADGKLLLLVPGSRKAEIRNNLPIMESVAKRHPEFRAVVAAAPGIDDDFYNNLSRLPRLSGVTFDLMAAAETALVTSGTATLEAALLGTPQVVCYRANGSRLTYNLFKRLLKVKFVSLPNLIADREIIPEMLLHQCTPEAVDARLTPLLSDTPERQEQLDGYAEMRTRLNPELNAPERAARIILDLV